MARSVNDPAPAEEVADQRDRLPGESGVRVTDDDLPDRD